MWRAGRWAVAFTGCRGRALLFAQFRAGALPGFSAGCWDRLPFPSQRSADPGWSGGSEGGGGQRALVRRAQGWERRWVPCHPGKSAPGESGSETRPSLVPAHLRGWGGLWGGHGPSWQRSTGRLRRGSTGSAMAKRPQSWGQSSGSRVLWAGFAGGGYQPGGTFPIVSAWLGQRAADTLCSGGLGRVCVGLGPSPGHGSGINISCKSGPLLLGAPAREGALQGLLAAAGRL